MKLSNVFITILKSIIRVVTILSIVYILIWLGFKGIIGIALGMSLMAWIFLSNNNMALFFVRMMTRDKTDLSFIDEIKKK